MAQIANCYCAWFLARWVRVKSGVEHRVFNIVGAPQAQGSLARHIFITSGKISVVSLSVRWRWNSEFDDFYLPQQYRAVAEASLGGNNSLRRHVGEGSALFAIIWRAVVPIALSPTKGIRVVEQIVFGIFLLS